MPKPMIRIHDLETNEIIDREMTAAEYASHQIHQAEIAAKAEAEATKAATKAALLERLGLSDEEAKILLS